MKTLVFFANPFGYGPAGKMVSIADYFQQKESKSRVVICGSSHVLSLTDKKFQVKEVNDRDESSITKALNQINGEKIIISSQNRFAIRSAKILGCKSAFLDGLSWFWKTIPDEHFDADIIFWIGYPEIIKKIPLQFSSKVHIIHGISPIVSSQPTQGERKLFYIGGCKNPLTELPYQYIQLTSKVLRAINDQAKFDVITDNETKSYIETNNLIGSTLEIHNLPHAQFVNTLASRKLLVSNGGQTASLEAAHLHIPTLYYLPINLSQRALINKIHDFDATYPSLHWEKYVNVPDNIETVSETEAITIFEKTSNEILSSKRKLSLLIEDTFTLINRNNFPAKPQLFVKVGSTGVRDIWRVLKSVQWI